MDYSPKPGSADIDVSLCFIDINECSSSPCKSPDSTCVNIPGSYECRCSDGWNGDGRYIHGCNGTSKYGTKLVNSVPSNLLVLVDLLLLNENSIDIPVEYSLA